jgi:dimethylamine monooxygenase subunit C
MERGYWIRSKPVYSALVWQQQANAHLVLVQGSAGGLAAMKLFQQMLPQQTITVIYETEAGDADYTVALKKVVPDDLQVFDSHAAAMKALEAHLPKALMGLRIYVAGSEKFMWDIAQIVKQYGVDDADIAKELTGTLARSVYCVHCKAITHNARTNIQACSWLRQKLICSRPLLSSFGGLHGLDGRCRRSWRNS